MIDKIEDIYKGMNPIMDGVMCTYRVVNILAEKMNEIIEAINNKDKPNKFTPYAAHECEHAFTIEDKDGYITIKIPSGILKKENNND